MNTISNSDAQTLSQNSHALLVDVREPGEFAAGHALGARLTPLSELEKGFDGLEKEGTYLLMCGGGTRARKAAEKLVALGYKDVRIVEGGFRAWKAAGLKTESKGSNVWAMDRQVRLVAGLLVLSGVGGALGIHPGWIALSAFVGGGLVWSALTDSCTMALILAKMPWNKTTS